MEPDEPCRQAGFAIASRTQACTGDADRANALYERFVEEYACRIGKLNKQQYRCAYNVNALDCQQVETFGDDIQQYLTEEGCYQILSRKDGTPMPVKGDAALVALTTDAECSQVVFRLAELESACGSGGDPADYFLLIATDLALDHSCQEGASASDVAACLADLDQVRCIDFSVGEELLNTTSSCQAVIRPNTQAQEIAPETAK